MINVLERGVIPDGVTCNTIALQRVLDECQEKGGGTLYFPPGRYLTGGLTLCSHLTLQFEGGAVLLGSTDPDDYTLYDPPPVRFPEGYEGVRALLYAHGCRCLRLQGAGTIDGQGASFRALHGMRGGRPRNIWFADCEDIAVEGLFLRNSAFWMQHYLRCSRLRLQGLDVYNHGGSNSDGCDIDCCRDVVVSNCRIDSHDDALCLKSGNRWPTENVVITNCITRTHCNHFKTGTESNGGFRNITISNLQMVPSSVRESSAGTQGADWRGACGIALGCVDGGMLENISITNVQMDQVRVPFFIKLGDRGKPIPGSDASLPVRHAGNIRLAHLVARQAGPTGGYLMGLPDAPVRGVTIADCELEFEGGGSDADAEAPVPLRRDAYPSCDAFGRLPAFGLYLRDAEDVTLHNIQFRLLAADARPALHWQRVRRLSLHQVEQNHQEEAPC